MTDVETLAEKLRPLIPKDVARWMRLRESADPELAGLIEQRVRDTARKLLGLNGRDDGPVLLSLPPAKAVSGPIRLGTVVYAGDRSAAGLHESDLLQNVSIFGRSGAGKTNAVFHILLQLSRRGVPWLFLDWKRTARHLLPQLRERPAVYTPGRSIAPPAFNPFTPPPALEPATYAGVLVDVLAEAYDLGDGAISILQRAIRACYAAGELSPSANDVLARVRALGATGRALGWEASATRALQSIDLAGLGAGKHTDRGDLVDSLLRTSTIFELDGLTAAGKRFLIPILCLWVYYQRLAVERREELGLVIVIEEAHHLLLREKQRGSESVMSMLLRQCREIGIGVIVVDQHPHLISPAALGNSAVTLAFNLKDPADVTKAAGLCGVEDAEKRCFATLPVGHAVVRLQERWRRPFLVRLPLVAVEKGSMTDAQLHRFIAGKPPRDARSAASGPGVTPSGGLGRVRPVDQVLTEHALRLLEDVIAHPDDGVAARYARLGLSGERGHHAQRALLEGGWAESQVVSVGNTRKVILRPTGLARGVLKLDGPQQGEGSIAHEYWRRWYAGVLRRAGFAVEQEVRRNGGRVDLLARKGQDVIGVEIETGKSDVVSNVRACLHAGCTRVLVIATDTHALEVVERRLAREGLLVPGRVSLAERERGWSG